MTHTKVNSEKLARKLVQAMGSTPITDVAKAAKIDVSRVSRFLNGNFKKSTPVLKKLCNHLGVRLDEFLRDPPPSSLSPEIVVSLQRIIGRDPKKNLAATRLIRSLEALALPGARKAHNNKRNIQN